LGVEIYSEYMNNHTYYHGMLKNWDNWKLLIGVIVSAGIPLLVIILSKRFSLKWFIVSLLAWLFLFSLIHIGVKAEIMWVGGFVVLLINTILLFAISVYFILGSLAFGTWVSDKILKFKENRWQEMFINFGIWLGVFLLFVRLLLIVDLFYWIIVWLIFLGLGAMIFLQRTKLSVYKEIVEWLFSSLNHSSIAKNPWLIIWVVLLLFSIMYYYYGFQLSFIPYSTAWDANHAYMYLPKIWMQNNWVFWSNGPGWFMPGLWHSFIAFWFGLAEPLKNIWLSPDTLAVAMNFLSGIFVLIFWLGLIKEVVGFVTKKLKSKIAEKEEFWKLSKQIAIYVGWMVLLLWLTSGMWAFLVFVDNKTDLWVMSMIILGLLSGFIFLRYISEHKKTSKWFDNEITKYIVISGVIFALAALAKPTAVIDIALFWLLVASLWFGGLFGLGWGFMAMWVVAKLWLVNAKDMMNSYSIIPNYFLIIGAVFIFLWIIIYFVKNRNSQKLLFQWRKKIVYLWIWVVTCLVMIFIAKAPVLAVNYIKNWGFSTSKFIKTIFLSQTTVPSKNVELNKILFASIEDISVQNGIDISIENNFNNVALDECKVLNFSDKELEKWLRNPPKWNEDVWRYVGYGYKTFNKKWILNFSNFVLRLIYSKDMKCYGINKEAKMLCENKYAVDVFHIPTMRTLFDKMDPDSEAYQIMSGALARFDGKWIVENDPNIPAVMRNDIVALRQYYQDYSPSRDFNPQAIRTTFNSVWLLLNQYSDKNKAGILVQKLQSLQLDIEWKYTQKTLKKIDLKIAKDEMLSILSEIESDLWDSDDYVKAYFMVKNLPNQILINVPYRYVVPLNIVYNWSLQNLSSYYTDIGFVWLIFFIFIFASVIYALIINHKKLLNLSIVTLAGRWVWWIIWWWILWYGIGLIMWTILVFAILCKELLSDSEDSGSRWMFFVMIWLVLVWSLIQFLFNFIRISSQGAGGPFVRYKMGAGKQVETNLQLTQSEKIKFSFGQQDVFDMQFGHYNPFIENMKNRKNEDGILIAGTYLPYFLENQNNLIKDGMLDYFWKMNSDWSSCKAYYRLKNKNIKYLVIDPNISSVVQWEGNESLFNKFFAQRNPLNGLIEDHWALTMLVKLWKEWYLELINTNNLWAKYAFEVSDNKIESAFFNTGDVNDDEILFIRAKMIIPNPRFFNDAQQLMMFIASVFDERVSNGKAISDIADVYGYIVDEQKVLLVTQKVLNSQWYPDAKMIAELTENERRVMLKYIEFYRLKQMKDSRYQKAVQSLLWASIGSSSQYVAYELK